MLKWIDVLKGLGIVAVVAGHIFEGYPSRLMYIFHMPLFFFISGHLFKIRHEEICYLKSKIRHLLVPYFTFLVLLYVPNVYIQLHLAELNFFEIAKAIARSLVGGRALSGWLGAFWFITCLFIVQQLMNALAIRFSMRWIGALMLTFLAGAYINSIFFPWAWLPWNANVALIAAPLFYIGWVAKSEKIEIPLILAFIGILISIGLLMDDIENSLDLKNSKYGIPFITILSSLCWIQLLIHISKWISGIKIISGILATLGEASMIIMFCHQPIQMIMHNTFGFSDPIVRFTTSIGISYFIYKASLLTRITRLVLLGMADKSALTSTAAITPNRPKFQEVEFSGKNA